MASGEKNPEKLFEAFVDGFTIGTVAADLAILAGRGIVYVGRGLARAAERGSMAVADAGLARRTASRGREYYRYLT